MRGTHEQTNRTSKRTSTSKKRVIRAIVKGITTLYASFVACGIILLFFYILGVLQELLTQDTSNPFMQFVGWFVLVNVGLYSIIKLSLEGE